MKELFINYWIYILIAAAFLGYVIYLLVTKNWPGLRSLAYMIMLRAEKVYKNTAGEEKLNTVLDTVYTKYPLIKLLIDKETLKKKLQKWYDIAKDVLDDGIVSQKPPEINAQ